MTQQMHMILGIILFNITINILLIKFPFLREETEKEFSSFFNWFGQLLDMLLSKWI